MTTDDRQLLDRYLEEGSDDAFRELVRRYMALVYSAAIRQVRNPQLAQDVTQLVFANLARKAHVIPPDAVLAGWLHRDTRYTALDLLRTEVRRAQREKLAADMNALNSEIPQDWERIRPLLDEALDELRPEDRDALLLRYFQERDFAEVGAALGASGEAARKRVDRALDRLREHLVKRGITTTAGALGVALSTHAVETVPAGFASVLVTGSAVVAAKTAAPAAGGWLANAFLMTHTKLIVGSVVIAAALATPLIFQQRAIAMAQTEQSALLARQRALPTPAELMSQRQASPNATSSAESDRADLERLRRETAALRQRLAELNQQAQARRAATAKTQNSNGTPINQLLRFDDLRDVGQATPAAALQTFFWAMTHGDSNRVAQLLAFDPSADATNAAARAWEDLGKALAEAAAKGPQALYGQKGPKEFRIIEEQPTETSDRWIVAEDTGTDGDGGNPVRFRFTWSTWAGGGWRLLIGTNGEPVGGPIKDEP